MVKLNIPRYKQLLDKKKGGSCGPSSIQQVLSYLGAKKSLKNLLAEIDTFKEYGTSHFGQLGHYVITQGFRATIYSTNLQIFDPTWFNLENKNLIEKLKSEEKSAKDFTKYCIKGYIKFLKKGGQLVFRPITAELVIGYLKRGMPVVAGICSSYLYRFSRSSKRGYFDDDINGKPGSHVLVIAGYKDKQFYLVDPSFENPYSKKGKYWCNCEDLIHSILLNKGGNILIIEKR